MTAFPVACVALFGTGLTSTLSPCVLPLVPGYLGVLSDADGQSGRQPRVLVFALGAGVTFVLLGGVASAVGLGVSAAVQWSQRAAGVCLVVLSVLMVLAQRGLIGREVRLVRRLPGQPHLRALLLGIGCGAAWSPCVGPLLGVALTAAGVAGSVGRGALLLACFALGVLTPFLAFSLVPAPSSGVVARTGRRLMSAASLGTAALGVALATGWYDDVVATLPAGLG